MMKARQLHGKFTCPNWREDRKGAGTDVQLVRGSGQDLWKSPSDCFSFLLLLLLLLLLLSRFSRARLCVTP